MIKLKWNEGLFYFHQILSQIIRNIANLGFVNIKAPTIMDIVDFQVNYQIKAQVTYKQKLFYLPHFCTRCILSTSPKVFRTTQHHFSQSIEDLTVNKLPFFALRVSAIFLFFSASFSSAFQYCMLAVTFSIYQFIGLSALDMNVPSYNRCVQIMYICHICKCIH